MAQAVLRPAVLDADLQMEEQLVRPGSPLDGKTVGTSGLRSRPGLILVAIKRPDGHLAFNPEDDAPVGAGDTLITLGSRELIGAVPMRSQFSTCESGAGAGRSSAPPALGALLGGLLGGRRSWSCGVTLVLKAGMDFVSGQGTWSSSSYRCSGWRSPCWCCTRSARTTTARSTGGRRVLANVSRARRSAPTSAPTSSSSAGEEERFPWRLAPIRALAILATVVLGRRRWGPRRRPPIWAWPPASALGDRGRWWRRLLRPAALAGGAAGVGALMGIPLVGTRVHARARPSPARAARAPSA